MFVRSRILLKVVYLTMMAMMALTSAAGGAVAKDNMKRGQDHEIF